MPTGTELGKRAFLNTFIKAKKPSEALKPALSKTESKLKLKPKSCFKKVVKPVNLIKPSKNVDKKHEADKKNKTRVVTCSSKSKITDYFNKSSNKTISDEVAGAKCSEVEKEDNPSQAELQSLAPDSSEGRIVPGLGTLGTRAKFVHSVVTNHPTQVISRDQVTACYRPCKGANLAPSSTFSLFKPAGASGSAEQRGFNSSLGGQARPENI